MNSAGRKSRRGERKRFLWIIINGRGRDGRSGVNDFIAKCVTGRINDSQQLFHRLAFYVRTVPVGKERRGLFSAHAEAHRVS